MAGIQEFLVIEQPTRNEYHYVFNCQPVYTILKATSLTEAKTYNLTCRTIPLSGAVVTTQDFYSERTKRYLVHEPPTPDGWEVISVRSVESGDSLYYYVTWKHT